MSFEDLIRAFRMWVLRRGAVAVVLGAMLAAAGCILLIAANASAQTPQASTRADQRQILDTLNTMFAAARTDDVIKFVSVVEPGFYIFDGGVRFDAQGLMAVIRAQHAMGKRYEWNVTEPDVHIDGNTAWVAYVNKGSISDASGTKEETWLESAVLQKEGSAWKLVFVHSTRVPQPAAEKPHS
jgi:ketosteroid isomerase-like protein